MRTTRRRNIAASAGRSPPAGTLRASRSPASTPGIDPIRMFAIRP